MINKYCRYCLEIGQGTVVRNWSNGRVDLEISGCFSCHKRHEEEVAALEAELTSLRNANANLKELRDDVEAKYSLALTNKTEEYQQLLLDVNRLKDENDIQKEMVQLLKELHGGWKLEGLDGPFPLAKPDLCALGFRSSLLDRTLQSSKSLPAVEAQLKLIINCTATAGVLADIIRFCYSGEISFSELVPPVEILRAAHALEIGLLKELCVTELRRQLSVDNVPQMLKLSKQFAVPKLQEEAEKLFKEHFDILKDKVYDVFQGSDDISKGVHDLVKVVDSEGI